jgi:Family of unknown function (DUF5329)
MPAPARADVEAILKALQSSGCQFNRNGSWYTGSEAQAHLTKKLDYLVRCMNGPAIESKTWLQDKLKAIRDLKR